MAVAVVEVEVAIIERLFSLAAGTCFSGCCCIVEVEVAIIERFYSLVAGTCFSGHCCCGDQVAIIERFFCLDKKTLAFEEKWH